MRTESAGIEEQRKEGKESGKEHKDLLPEIEDLRRPIESLLRQLREKIEGGGYDFVVGEDASGRVPASIFARVLEILQKERGHKPPQIRFFAGRAQVQEVEKKIKSWGERAGCGLGRKPALVVTDTIASGGSIKPICRALHENGFDFDVATVGFPKDETEEQSQHSLRWAEDRIGHKILVGGWGTPEIYQMHDFGGVEKEEGIFAKPIKHRLPREVRLGAQERINQTREGIKQIAGELVQYYHEQEEERRKQGQAI